MRQINHIAYTPAPDIVHEAARSILCDNDYSEYLSDYAKIGLKVSTQVKILNFSMPLTFI